MKLTHINEHLLESEREKALSIILTEQTKLYTGTFYHDRTRIRQTGMIFKRTVRGSASFVDRKSLSPIFIIGYELVSNNVIFEIWYDPASSKYSVYDRYGSSVSHERNELEYAVNDLTDIIEDYENLRNDRDQVNNTRKRQERQRIRNQARRNVRESEDSLEEQFEYTKAELGRNLNATVRTYKTTRFTGRSLSGIWRRILGGIATVTPSNYRYDGAFGGLKRRFDILLGREKDASFVIGYTLNDIIDVEIWYVRDTKTGRNRFYVFNLTSYNLIGNALTMKEAIKLVSDKIMLPDDYDVPKDDVSANSGYYYS